MKKSSRIFFKHLLVVLLCFSTEVKVKAFDARTNNYSIIKQHGFIEVEKQSDGSLDIQTFKKGSIKIQYLGATVSLKENTFVSVGKRLQVHFGVVFVQSMDSDNLVVHTKQGIVKVEKDSVLIVSVNKDKTSLSVLMGVARLDDRIQINNKIVRAGYQTWIGGLTAKGAKATGGFEPIDINSAEENFKLYSQHDDIAKNIAIDSIKTYWKKAAEDIARQTQDEVKGSMELLAQWEEENKKRDLASLREKNKIKEQFRAHALDLPYQNKEDPSE